MGENSNTKIPELKTENSKDGEYDVQKTICMKYSPDGNRPRGLVVIKNAQGNVLARGGFAVETKYREAYLGSPLTGGDEMDGTIEVTEEHRGQGLGRKIFSEALNLLLQVNKDEELGIKKIIVGTGKNNIQMSKIAETHGFIRQQESPDIGFIQYIKDIT